MRLALLGLLCGLALSPAASAQARDGAASGAETVSRVRGPHVDGIPAGPSVEARLAEIQRRVQAAASYPESARLRGASGEVQVAFEIEPDGSPVEIEVVDSSGSLALDRAAAKAVRDAGALPRVIGRVNVPVHFSLVAPR